MPTTLQVSDELAARIQAFGTWLPDIIELSLLGFRTPVAAAAAETISFLSRNPTPREVLKFHVANETQEHLRRLLTLNSAGLLSAAESCELDEIERLEAVIFKLKTKSARHLQAKL